MSFKNLIYLTLFTSVFSYALAQQEYIPRNIQQAYDKGTRSIDGTPGPNYWQNSSDYKIKAEFNPFKRLLTGSETITYHNNSPDTLSQIVIRLYQNINSPNAARNFAIGNNMITDGMNLDTVFIDGVKQDLNDYQRFVRMGTLFFIKLVNQPLLPHSNINLNFDWDFTLSEVTGIRMGAYDSTSFLLGYWYPQVSVYDDIDGWDIIPYTGIQEFYNDFSNYDVKITVPDKFAVWGTGILQNPDEIFTDEYLNKYKSAFKSDNIINIISKDDLDKHIFKNQNEKNTWHYKAENVTDVVYGTSDHYLWDATSYEVEPGRRVYIAAVYKKESQDFYGVAKLAKQCIDYFSNEMPAVPFPFPSFTVFNGEGGMEFPMLINDGTTETYNSTVGLTSHENAHQYFPFYMGTNESKYAWMDEGWAVFLPTDLEKKLINDRRRIDREVQNFDTFAGTENDIPLFVTTDNMSYRAYRQAAYTRPGLSYLFLRNVLGDEKFLDALHLYMKNWHGKHPIPFDYFFSFNKAVGKDLSWFWDPWYFKRDYADLGLKNVVLAGGKVSVEVEKIGKLPVPVHLTFIYSDATSDSVSRPAAVWEFNNSIKIEFRPAKTLTKVILGSPDIPDIDTKNNSYEVEKNHF
jgi:Peptidase family M1 domain